MTRTVYTLMLLDRAERIRDFDTREEALEALNRFVEAEPTLQHVAAIRAFEDGEPTGEPITASAAQLVLS